MSIQEKLLDWAKETVDVYNPIAETLKKGYYTQTPLSLVSQSPDLLILGINPGAEGGNNMMKEEELLKGNPCFENKDKKNVLSDKEYVIYVMKERKDIDKNIKGWALWHRLNSMLEKSINHKELLHDFNRFVLSNMIFFGTAKEKQIPKIDKDKCAERTLKLIDCLEPKVVILLGKQCRDLFNRLNKKGKLEVLIPNSIYHCMYGKSHVLAIKHTSYYYSSEEMAVVGKTIGYVLDNIDGTINKETISASYVKEDIIRSEEKRKANPSIRKKKVDCQRIVELVTSCKDFHLSKIENTSERYSLSDNLLLTITKTGKGYLAIRHKTFNGKIQYPDLKYDFTERYRSILKEKGWNCDTPVWLGTKFIKDFGHTDDEIVTKILSEINDIVELFGK